MRDPAYVTSFNDAWQEFMVAKADAELAEEAVSDEDSADADGAESESDDTESE